MQILHGKYFVNHSFSDSVVFFDKTYSCLHRMTATVFFLQIDNLITNIFSYLSLVHVDYVNYHVVIFMAHLHLNELSLICDMWLNKITYLLTYLLT